MAFRMPFLEQKIVQLKKKKGEFLEVDRQRSLETVPPVKLQNQLPEGFSVGLVKDLDNYNGEIQKVAHWYKYERFLIQNNIDYDFFSVHSSNWVDCAQNFNLIVFRPDISPWALHEARSKIFFIEEYLKIQCFPSHKEIWSYEDKINLNYLYKFHKVPHVPTFISHNKVETLEFLNQTEYPLVSKIINGSASKGVHLIKNKKKAEKFVKKVFAEGMSTYWPGFGQKNYVYFQPLIKHKGYDLRIIIVGDKAFGYYKMVPKNDFRASGSMLIRKTNLPVEAVEIALNIKNKFSHTFLAVDFLEDSKSGNFMVLETSVFVDIYTSSQAIVNGLPGYYKIATAPFRMEFCQGEVWLQELILEELLNEKITKNLKFNLPK
tara:strand:- start:62705 stop:63832 length:1128 start_codon:yes stop_codon:yes gene_type:complete